MITQSICASVVTQLTSVCYSPLKYQRLLRGWSQQDVVDALYQLCSTGGCPGAGLSIYTISRWENGKNLPSPLYRKHLCALYGLTAAQLGFIEAQEGQV